MNNTIFLDNFSGSVGELKPRQKGNMMIVLDVLSHDPNVSTWDMDDNQRYPLWKTIEKLEKLSYIKSVERNYPWLRYEVTELGKKVLSEHSDRK
jgi:hypothetical protein